MGHDGPWARRRPLGTMARGARWVVEFRHAYTTVFRGVTLPVSKPWPMRRGWPRRGRRRIWRKRRPPPSFPVTRPASCLQVRHEGGSFARAEGHCRALAGGQCARGCAPCPAEAPARQGPPRPAILEVPRHGAEVITYGVRYQIPDARRRARENGPATGEKA